MDVIVLPVHESTGVAINRSRKLWRNCANSVDVSNLKIRCEKKNETMETRKQRSSRSTMLRKCEYGCLVTT